jgi:hypothetical protein
MDPSSCPSSSSSTWLAELGRISKTRRDPHELHDQDPRSRKELVLPKT